MIYYTTNLIKKNCIVINSNNKIINILKTIIMSIDFKISI